MGNAMRYFAARVEAADMTALYYEKHAEQRIHLLSKR